LFSSDEKLPEHENTTFKTQKSIHAQFADQLFCISQLVSFTKTPKLRLLTIYGYNSKYNAVSMHQYLPSVYSSCLFITTSTIQPFKFKQF